MTDHSHFRPDLSYRSIPQYTPSAAVGHVISGRKIPSGSCDDERFSTHGAFIMGDGYADMMLREEVSVQDKFCEEKTKSGKKRRFGNSSVSGGEVVESNERESLRKQKHKEVEIRRRQRISSLFDELRDVLDCTATDRSSILAFALKKIKSGSTCVVEPEPQPGDEVQCAVTLGEMQSSTRSTTTPESTLPFDPLVTLSELPTPFALCTLDNKVLFLNRSLTREFGYSMDDFQGHRNLFDVLSPSSDTTQLFSKCCEGIFDVFRVVTEISLKGCGKKSVRIVASMNFVDSAPSSVTLMFERP